MRKIKFILVVVILAGVAGLKAQNNTSDTVKIKTDTVKDFDGKIYSTVFIGTQEWMAENLSVSHFRNGDAITEAKSEEEWRELCRNKKPAWCYYENNPKIGQIYGKLYNWFAVSDPRGLAPAGWSVPMKSEWKIFFDSLGGESVAGGKMKESDTTHWTGPNEGASNISGFKALPAGYRSSYGTFSRLNLNCDFWTSTENTASSAWAVTLSWALVSVSFNDYDKQVGYSVRCLKK